MTERAHQGVAHSMRHFVYSVILPKLMTFDMYQQDKIFEMISRELPINFFVIPRKGTFQELVERAQETKVLNKSLALEGLNYFPHKNENIGNMQFDYFDFLLVRKLRLQR